MRHRGWMARVLFLALTAAVSATVFAAAAEPGSQSDPLVTLSYLNDTYLAQVLDKVDAKIAQREAELQSRLAAVVDGYVKEVEDKLRTGGSSTAPAAAGAAYQVVTLSAGQTITGGAACEFLLRSGTAVCVSSSAPGLVDMTGAATLANGGALAANHLYLATVEGRGVKASTAVTLMVRGSYTISG